MLRKGSHQENAVLYWSLRLRGEAGGGVVTAVKTGEERPGAIKPLQQNMTDEGMSEALETYYRIR